MKIYLAREVHEDDNWAEKRFFGEIGIFYDTPIWEWDADEQKLHWCKARRIGTAPAYMYPELQPNKYAVLCSGEEKVDMHEIERLVKITKEKYHER